MDEALRRWPTRAGGSTAEKVAAGRGSLPGLSVFLCGPPPMTASLVTGFRRLGVPRSRLRWEQFAER